MTTDTALLLLLADLQAQILDLRGQITEYNQALPDALARERDRK
jgi:hypothetical protein